MNKTQHERILDIIAKREANIALTEGEYALFLDYSAFLLRQQLAEDPPDLAAAINILEVDNPTIPSIPDIHTDRDKKE